ncbi:MAG: hypothetical protein ABL921_22150 [Pirellula sp.]
MILDVGERIRSHLNRATLASLEQEIKSPAIFYSRFNLASVRERVSVRIQGVHELEWIDDKPCVWSDGHARLDCVFSRPRSIGWCSIDLDAGPTINTISVGINHLQPVKLTAKHRRTFLIQLKKPISQSTIVLRLDSDTFLPSQLLRNTDCRMVGVMIREICFAKYLWRLPVSCLHRGTKFRRL